MTMLRDPLYAHRLHGLAVFPVPIEPAHGRGDGGALQPISLTIIKLLASCGFARG
jgi:hypothetical protein